MWAEINSTFKAIVNPIVKVNTKTACEWAGLQSETTGERKSSRWRVCGLGHQPAGYSQPTNMLCSLHEFIIPQAHLQEARDLPSQPSSAQTLVPL